jgi:predicted AAA+ superfamily ATPase
VETFDSFLRKPKLLDELAASGKYEWIILDEVQRLPLLLNSVHRLIEKLSQKFALTGSSSRKLRRGAGNLLGGRAFVNSLFPLVSEELGDAFRLEEVLRWGSLPKVYSLKTDMEKAAYLRSYYLTYIREEIQQEQTVRKLEPFREFLAVAAQCSGKIINFSAIAREVGVQVTTVQNYYQILEDTYIGFFLPHFHRSIRKSQLGSPKFYLFDCGVKKALEGSLNSDLTPGTSGFGDAFESMLIQEIFRLNEYATKDFRLSFFRTKNDAEIDLILTRGKKTILVEFKSSEQIDEVEVNAFGRLAGAFGEGASAFFVSRSAMERQINNVNCLPWDKFLKLFLTM